MQAGEAQGKGLALTTIEPSTLLALVAAVAEGRDRIGLQGATIASQATEIHRLKREIAAAVEAAK